MSKGKVSRTTVYEVINAKKLKNDVKKYCFDNSIVQDDFYDQIGIGKCPLSNATHNAERNTNKIDFSQYEYCEEYGLIQKIYLVGICSHAGLNINDYICKKRTVKNSDGSRLRDYVNNITEFEKDVVSIRVSTSAMLNILCKAENGINSIPNINNKIDTLIEAINTLGKVQAQSMEYLKSISDGIQTMNDKYNKPSAYIRK